MIIAGVTTTRADYGLLYWPFKTLLDRGFDLKVLVGGMHLLELYGESAKAVEKDGFPVFAKLDFLKDHADTAAGTIDSLACATTLFGQAYEQMKPDLVLVLGDRYEILAAVQAALVQKIPVAHIAGGDTTEGAFDESCRHAITKMSHIHFVTNEMSRKRVIQMGENPDYVFNVGSPGLDFIRRTKFAAREELEKDLNFKFREKNILVTFHPETLVENTEANCAAMLNAIKELSSRMELGVVITLPNADPQGLKIMSLLERFAKDSANVVLVSNLGSRRYLSVMKESNAVVGNSSSGVYEAPALKIPTVNIGLRQQGRLQASSIINAGVTTDAIVNAMIQALELDCSNVECPFGNGDASFKIANILEKINLSSSILRKRFFMI